MANHVQKINLSSDPQQWSYIPTNEIPAYHSSTGLTPSELLSSKRVTYILKDTRLPADEVPELTIGDHNSEVVTGYLSCCSHSMSMNSFNTVTDKMFNVNEKWKVLSKSIPLPSHNPLYLLGTFLHENDIHRVGGRLCNYALPYSTSCNYSQKIIKSQR